MNEDVDLAKFFGKGTIELEGQVITLPAMGIEDIPLLVN